MVARDVLEQLTEQTGRTYHDMPLRGLRGGAKRYRTGFLYTSGEPQQSLSRDPRFGARVELITSWRAIEMASPEVGHLRKQTEMDV